ncbi:hypothetical protein TH30_08845 [Thalassospira profundimaris]|uniref:Uncharacterized protein n=2 Tax=Thalassospira profundimaris TaxID=502049 RepID=A0A367WZ71_9PROT|nr:hypothetical protein TH30_08845 [Thalassospira profundimaris]
MGVLIVIGIGLVAYGLSLDKNAKDENVSNVMPAPVVPIAGENAAEGIQTLSVTSIPAFGDIKIKIEPGELLVGYSVQGTQAILQIEDPNGMGARLVVVSLTDKKVIGRILLEPDAQ